MSEKPTLQQIQETVANFLASIAPVFTPGCLLTFFMRHPDIPSAHLIISDDTIGGVRKGLDQLEKSLDPSVTTISNADPATLALEKAKTRIKELSGMIFGLTRHIAELNASFTVIEDLMRSGGWEFSHHDFQEKEEFRLSKITAIGQLHFGAPSLILLAQEIAKFNLENEKPQS